MNKIFPYRGLLLGIALSGAFLFLAFRNINLGRFIDNFKYFNPIYLVPIGSLLFLYYLMQSFRWKYILISRTNIPFLHLLQIITLAAMITTIFPARLGDFLRSYALSKKEGLRKSFCLATIVMEKSVDLAFAIFLFTITINYLRLPEYLWRPIYILTAFLIALFMIILLIALLKDKAFNFIGLIIGALLPSLKEKTISIFYSFFEGFLTIKKFSSLLLVLLYTLLSWSVLILAFYLALISFGIKVPLTAAITLVLILTVGFNLPVSPGYVGTFQIFSIIALSFFGIEKSIALSFSFVLQFINIIFPVCFGLFFAWRDNLFNLIKLGN